MADPLPVVMDPEDESPEEAQATQPAEDLTTWKKRLAGKDQALSATKKALSEREAELEALRTWKAEQERANMSEVEKLRLDLEQARSEAETARSAAQRERLARLYPLATETFGEEDTLPSEATLKTLNERLAAATAGDETVGESRIDPNNPRRRIASSKPPTTPELVERLKREAAALFAE